MRPNEIEDWQGFLKDNGCENIIDFDDWVMCNCIFHSQTDETRPSMGINKESGVANCFGCGTHVWSDLCEVFGISAEDFIEGIRERDWIKFKDRLLGNNVAVKKYRRYKLPDNLANPLGSKGAVKYLVNERGFDVNLLEDYGVRLCRDVNSRYYKYLIFPIEDEKGVLFFDARNVGNIDDYHPRWKRPEDCAVWKTYFNWVNVLDSGVLFFCEGVPDALKLIQFGFPAIPAKSFSPYQLHKLREQLEYLVLIYDNDEAGRQKVNKYGKEIHFTAKALSLFSDCGITIKVAKLPDYAKDPAEVKSKKHLLGLNTWMKAFC